MSVSSLASISVPSSYKVYMEGPCERQRSVVKMWEDAWLKITNREILVMESKKESPKRSHPYLEIRRIRKCSYNASRPYCVSIQTRKAVFWYSWKTEEEVTHWYDGMNAAWREYHSAYTGSKTTPDFLMRARSTSQSSTDENAELDAQLGVIMCKLLNCTDQDSLKTYLLDVEAYQNGKPIEEVVTQKALASSFFDELKRRKADLLTKEMLSYIDNLVDGFDDTNIDTDPILVDMLEATEVDIHSIVDLSTELGHGKFGTVFRGVLRSSGESVAVKVIRKRDLTEKDQTCLKRECRIMYELRDHSHIISLREFCQDDDNYYIVEELAEGGELFDAISKRKCYSEREAQNLVRTLLYTLRYCHEKRVVHRDLKPENILLKSADDFLNIRIADFGFATHAESNQSLHTLCGTPGYSAPEIIRGEPYGPAVDMWSLGVITYILLCGYPPFPQTNEITALRMVVSGSFQFYRNDWDGVSEDAKDFIRALLVPNPERRATAKMACSMRWMQFESTRTMHMNAAVQQLVRFNARRKDKGYSGGGNVSMLPEPKISYYISLTRCGVRDNPSLARSMTSVIPPKMKVAAKEVVFTSEGTWALLYDRCGHNWLMVEKHGYDPMCVPEDASIYQSVYPRGEARHNVRLQPMMSGKVVGTIPAGFLFLGVSEVRNEEGIWVELHKQTLHSFDIPSYQPCFINVVLAPSTVLAKKLK